MVNIQLIPHSALSVRSRMSSWRWRSPPWWRPADTWLGAPRRNWEPGRPPGPARLPRHTWEEGGEGWDVGAAVVQFITCRHCSDRQWPSQEEPHRPPPAPHTGTWRSPGRPAWSVSGAPSPPPAYTAGRTVWPPASANTVSGSSESRDSPVGRLSLTFYTAAVGISLVEFCVDFRVRSRQDLAIRTVTIVINYLHGICWIGKYILNHVIFCH